MWVITRQRSRVKFRCILDFTGLWLLLLQLFMLLDWWLAYMTKCILNSKLNSITRLILALIQKKKINNHVLSQIECTKLSMSPYINICLRSSWTSLNDEEIVK